MRPLGTQIQIASRSPRLIQAGRCRQHHSSVSHPPTHYSRFARAIALVAVAGSAFTVSGCCPLVPTSMVCAHCECPYRAGRSVARPVMCESIGRTDDCCPVSYPVSGPLAPPNLAIA